MISASEARKLSGDNVAANVKAILQLAESEIKRKAKMGQTTCYIELEKVGYEVHAKLKELLTAEGFKVEIGGRQGDTPHLNITW